MDPFKTPGAFSWCELMTTDPKAAVEFYGTLFGWKVEPMDMGMPYNVLKAGEAPVGGIMGMAPNAPAGMPPAWSCYVTVPDIDATAAQCAQLGGKVLLAPQDIPTVGRFAVLQDPQGAVFNAISYLAA